MYQETCSLFDHVDLFLLLSPLVLVVLAPLAIRELLELH